MVTNYGTMQQRQGSEPPPGLREVPKTPVTQVLKVVPSERPFRRRRHIPEVDATPYAGTVRAVSTCSEFNLQNIAGHYRSRGCEVRENEGYVWLIVNVPSYKFDSQLEDDQSQPSHQSHTWLDISNALEGSSTTYRIEDDRPVTIDESDNEADSRIPRKHLMRPGREYEYNVFFHIYGVLVWWSPFPPSHDLETAGMPLLKEVARMRSLFEMGSHDKLKLDTCRWAVAPPEELEKTTLRAKRKEARGPPCYIDQDCFYISNSESEYMMAYGCGLAQSAKVAEFEDKIDTLVEDTKEYPIDMARTGKCNLSRNEVAKIRGILFLHKMDVNLHTDILETPDVFWNRTDLEPLYLQARRYMEISHRTEVLNKRLEIVHQLFEVVHEELNTKHGNHLEWIIIWLILVELLIGTASTLMSLAGYH